jgi:D-amino-acid oxidase
MTGVPYRRKMHARPDVLIIGAGVSGLSTALCLAEEGIDVEVVARQLPLETTSCAAAAMWAPYLVTDARLKRWSLQTHDKLITLGPEMGVRQVHGREVARDRKRAPAWMRRLPHHRVCAPDEIPFGFRNGWWYEAPVVDMPAYLTGLAGKLRDLGIEVQEGTVDSLVDALRRAPIVVNCTGVDARDLAGDRDLTPVRGQLVVVENPGIDRFYVEHDETPLPTYFMPHDDRLVLGGSIEPRRADRTPDDATAKAIRQRCADIEPAIADARLIEHRVGIRPQRTRVRLERVALNGGHVIHNYGHGGAGVTLSWGCALEVRRLVREVMAVPAVAAHDHDFGRKSKVFDAATLHFRPKS